MTTKFQDLLVSTIGALVWLGLSWGWARSVRRGCAMTPPQRKMLWYSFGFILGMCYIMMFGSWFAWPHALWFVLIAAWGVMLALVAWWRHKKNERLAGSQHPKVPVRTYFSVGLPFLGVLASLIMGAIEWNFVAEGQGHLWQALAWTAALAASIWLAGKNRRVVVEMAFRVFLVLGVIGAIGHPTPAALVAVGVVAVAYFLIERLWPKQKDPPVLDFEALSRNKSD